MSFRLRWPLAAALAGALLPADLLFAQTAPSAPVAAAAIAPVIEALDALRPMEDSAFPVHNFLITHDVSTLTLSEGKMWPLSRVNGRVVGAVFQGTGRIRFIAPNPEERERMRHYLGEEELDDSITSVVLLFTDGTLDAFYRLGVSPAHMDAPGTVGEQIARARDYLKTYKDRTWDPAFLEPVLNGRENGMFFALIQRVHGEELILQIDPDDPEPIHLGIHSQAPGADVDPEWVTQFAWTDRPPPPRDQRRREVDVTKYTLDINMPLQGDGGIGFASRATLQLRAPAGGYGPWIPFYLSPDLDVDSARWDGQPVPVYKNDDAYVLWARAPGQLAPGATATLDLGYHGDLLARYGDWFVLKSSIEWYPLPMDVLSRAAFDITYHTPVGYPIGSVGLMTDSSVSGRIVTSHWVHEAPMRNAGFNIGRFEEYELGTPGTTPVTLLWSEAGHRALGRDFHVAPMAHVREVITDEVASSLHFFANVYGPPLESRFFATEIPLSHGEAFPGLIHYWYGTFLPEDAFTPPMPSGFNQLFRAHEVAHQWWGIGVDFASYRDQWLSEGLAEFSGLWYLQTRTGSFEKYDRFLHDYRDNLLVARGHIGATSLGHRTGTGRDPKYYDYAVYQKGAWTMHMLRILLLQLSTMNEDRFTNAMREFYTTHRGGSASTDDLRQVMEKYAGADLGWFFHEWVDGTDIPTYTWAWRAEPGANGGAVAHFRVRQSNVPEDFQMYVPVVIELKDGRALKTRLHVTGPVTDAALPVPGEIKAVRFNELDGVLAEVKTEGW